MSPTLAGVWAHPDDECYAMYGTVVRHGADPGFRLVVLHATDGDAGEIAPGVPAEPASLGAWRRRGRRRLACAGDRGVPDDEVGVVVRHREGLERMLAAHKEHRSQRHVMFDPSGTDERWMQVLSLETWVVAWPPRAPGNPVLTDVFEGLA